MENIRRYRSSLEHASCSASNAVSPQEIPLRYEQDRGTPFTGNFRGWRSSRVGSYQASDIFRDAVEDEHDAPPDNLDMELLAVTQSERSFHASQGRTRLSLPTNAISLSRTNAFSQSFNAYVPPLPDQRHDISSSPASAWSPTVSAVQRGQTRRTSHLHSASTTGGDGGARGSYMSTRQTSGPSRSVETGRIAYPASTHAPPVVQGIHLVPIIDIPDRFRGIFPYKLFNAIQSKCFLTAFRSDDNLVLSSPTGSGKTAVMELAVCRLASACKNGDFKIVYQAPTKSLCAERHRDWEKKFACLNLKCAELTGDTEHTQLRSVQSADIIITTPEKWDSVTRKWKDHAKLMQLVRLFLIDEVHILKESRGAILEAGVSRMKSVGSNVRFVALSATVPNSDDIAAWLGQNSAQQHRPAQREVFGEEFRPVRLQKFVYGYQAQSDDFAFDEMLNKRVPEFIAQHSRRKPVIIFCCTRKSAFTTSLLLADLWKSTKTQHRLWSGPRSEIRVTDGDLRKTLVAGVAFHHGGLEISDRQAVETGFLNGAIKIICCTSTLAVGVNLPCYLVIIKGTVGWTDHGAQEYPDLEVMQMLGRAGRPQFESSACAVILTRAEKVQRYQKMESGAELLESCLHLNLIDHLNAEIGLGTVYDKASAKKWLAGTFLAVRLKENPSHYRLKEDIDHFDHQDPLEQICDKDVKLLEDADLIRTRSRYQSTEFGDAMALYYVKFETMKMIMSLPPRAKISEILSVLSQALEFREIRFKSGEKSLYKEFNEANAIRFPIKVDLAMQAQKVSLLIQTELGGAIYPAADTYSKHRSQFQLDKASVFSLANRLIRCIIDCQVQLQDAVSTRHALELGRSLAARVWDNSSSQLKQVEQIGDVGVRQLAAGGINSIETLQATEAHRIEELLGRNPPFGKKILSKAADFPSLRVSVKEMGKEYDSGKRFKIRFRADIGFLNDKVPLDFRRKPVYVCFLAETSDGRLVDFRRFGANKIKNGQEILLSTQLTKPTTSINCYVMCDEIAGTCRRAELKLHDIPAFSFLPIEISAKNGLLPNSNRQIARRIIQDADEFDGLNDDDLVAAAEIADMEVVEDIDDLVGERTPTEKKAPHKRTASQVSNDQEGDSIAVHREAEQLPNGRSTCQHDCNEKRGKGCHHECCKADAKKPARPRKKRSAKNGEDQVGKQVRTVADVQKSETAFETAKSIYERSQKRHSKPGTGDARSSNELREPTGIPSVLLANSITETSNHTARRGRSPHTRKLSSEFDVDWLDEIDSDYLPTPWELRSWVNGNPHRPFNGYNEHEC